MLRRWLYRNLLFGASRLRGRNLPAVLGAVEASQWWPREKIEAFQLEKLQRLVARLYERSPHYHRMLGDAGVAPADIRSLDDLSRLPVMTKEVIRDYSAALRTTDISDSAVQVGVTGGTTGAPMRVARDVKGTDWSGACYLRGLAWGGLELGAPRARLFGGSLGLATRRRFDGLRSWFAGDTFLPAFELGPNNVGDYVRTIRQSGARHLIGYSSACYSLASLCAAQNISLSFDAVFPTAEALPPPWADVIASSFGARVMPYYGCGELNSLAYTCPIGELYHVCDEHALIEVQDARGNTSLTGEGAFLITDLDNVAMPIIRYANGDAGRIDRETCECGRALTRLTRIDGRVNDMLVTASGGQFSGVIATHLFRQVRAVDAYQFVQRRPGHVMVRIKPEVGYDAATEEAKMKKVLLQYLGEGGDVEFEYVESIPKTAAGKARFVINEYLTGQAEEHTSATR